MLFHVRAVDVRVMSFGTVKGDDSTLGAWQFSVSDESVQGTESFLESLASDAVLQRNTLERYKELRRTAKP